MNRDGVFRKAFRSSFEGNCVEVAAGMVQVAVRNSRDPDGPRLLLSYPAYRAFIELALEVGEFRSPRQSLPSPSL